MAEMAEITNQVVVPTEEAQGTVGKAGIKYPYIFPDQKFGAVVGAGGAAICCGSTVTKQKAQLLTAPSTRFAFRLARQTNGDLLLAQSAVSNIKLLVNGPSETGAQNGLWWDMQDADTQNIQGGAFDARDCVFLIFGMSFAFEGIFRRGDASLGQTADALYNYADDMNGAGSYAERALRQIAHGVASLIVSQGSNACTLLGGNIAQSYNPNVVVKDGEFVGTQLQLGPYNPFVYPWLAGAKDDGDQMGVNFSASRDMVIANDPNNPTVQDLHAFFRCYFFGIRVPRAALVNAGITCSAGPVARYDALVQTQQRMDRIEGALSSIQTLLANR
jgi:hypothetical protein